MTTEHPFIWKPRHGTPPTLPTVTLAPLVFYNVMKNSHKHFYLKFCGRAAACAGGGGREERESSSSSCTENEDYQDYA